MCSICVNNAVKSAAVSFLPSCLHADGFPIVTIGNKQRPVLENKSENEKSDMIDL